MKLDKLKKLSLKTQFSVLAIAVLAFGVFVSVRSSQQKQATRSHAAGTGGTGNCSTVNVSSGEDLVADNCTIASGFNGSIFGSNNIIQGGLGGPVGDIFGNGNEVFGGVNGCINGNNNTIHGGVNGGVNGTGNIIQGGQGSGACPNPSDAPPVTPTTPVVSRCADGIDNDNNGFTDIQDSTCHTDGNPQNPGTYDPNKDGEHGGGNTCADSKDNNGNNLIDGVDPICHTDGNANNPGSYDPNRPEGTQQTSRCSDGIDNDNNGVKDQTDASCHTDHNPQNQGSYDPNKDGEHGGGNTCLDSKDNNNNGVIDGGDPVCHSDGDANNPDSFDFNLPEGGNVTPTVPPTGNTIFNLNLLLHGVGKGGDSANPQSGGNANPLHPQRTVKVQIYNKDNQLVVTKESVVNFNSGAGNFTGTIDMGAGIADGPYIIKVKTDQFLNTNVPGIQTITGGTTNNLPQTTLVNGDINGDNTINIQDYNILMGCYSDFLPATSCTAANKSLADIDDDGLVAQFDYNLFLRELTNRQGQ